MEALFSDLKHKQERPAFVVMRTVIGKGSPHKAGTSKAHGSPLGPEEVALTKEGLGLPKEEFYVPQAVHSYFKQRLERDEECERDWNDLFPPLGSRLS
jgi:transketolase